MDSAAADVVPGAGGTAAGRVFEEAGVGDVRKQGCAVSRQLRRACG